MNPSDLEALAIKLAAFTGQLEQRSERAIECIQASVTALAQGEQQLTAGSEHFATEALRVIAAQAQQVITDNVGHASAQLNSQLLDGARSAEQAARGLATQRAQLNRAQTTLVWKALAALIAGSLLAAAVSGYFVWKSSQQLEQVKFGADILRATQSGSLTRCGNALCAKVGNRPERYRKDRDYVLLQP